MKNKRGNICKYTEHSENSVIGGCSIISLSDVQDRFQVCGYSDSWDLQHKLCFLALWTLVLEYIRGLECFRHVPRPCLASRTAVHWTYFVILLLLSWFFNTFSSLDIISRYPQREAFVGRKLECYRMLWPSFPQSSTSFCTITHPEQVCEWAALKYMCLSGCLFISDIFKKCRLEP